MQSSNSLRRRSSMATAADPPAQVVANAFVHQYYHILHSSPQFVFRFYHEESKLGRPDATGEMTSISGLEAINEKILSMNCREIKADIKTVDAQESLAGGLTVLITGCLTGKDEVRRSFTQSFFLAPQDKGYYVLNDIFRSVDDAEAAVPVAAAAELGKLPHKLPGIRTKVASMEVTNTPEEDNKLAHDKPASAEQFFNCDICKVHNTHLHHKALLNMKTGNREETSLKVECDDDEDCCEIDPIILTSKLTFDDMDDVALVAAKGPVALRDFPHPRHLCGCFPFGTTSHESFCTKVSRETLLGVPVSSASKLGWLL